MLEFIAVQRDMLHGNKLIIDYHDSCHFINMFIIKMLYKKYDEILIFSG